MKVTPKKSPSKRLIRIALSGASGRMGKAIFRAVKEEKKPKFKIQALRLPLNTKWEAKKIDGVVDFSSPALFFKTLQWALKHKKPFLSGTTGLKAREKSLLKKASNHIPLFYESNMSLGVFLLKSWVHQFQKLMGGLDKKTLPFSIFLEDIHHKDKKDKPSGTAIKLKESFGPRLKKKISIKSIRKGREFGTHRIHFIGKEEKILLQHKALNRLVFAKGALLAIKWLVDKSKGYYTMEDLYKS